MAEATKPNHESEIVSNGPPPDHMTVRGMTRPDLERVLVWAAEEGWNPGLADAACFHAADPQGFLMGFIGDEPIASISVVRYCADFGFLGLYIVRPKHRGMGYGMRLWEAGLQRLDSRTVGLDGVVARQSDYSRSGFQLLYRNLRFSGAPVIARTEDVRLHVVTAPLLASVLRFDRRYFPAERGGFLACWLAQTGHHALALLEDGDVKGYGVARPCRTGWKIGPLFADRERDADVLFRALAAAAGATPIIIDVPEPNRAALALVARYGLAPDFETARMYRGRAPEVPLEGVFGVTTLELG
jgi:GNAT superfamily N-acetyltransferase